MSIESPAPSPVQYAGPSTNGVPRPTSVSVLAGIGIVLGSGGILCKPAGAIVQLMVKLPQPNPVIDLFRNDPALRAFTIAGTATGTLLSMLLLMSSLGSLLLKRWARGGMLAYAALAMLMTFITQAVGYFIVNPEVQRVMRQAGIPQTPGTGWLSGPIGIVMMLLIGLWYPVLISVFYNRPRVKEAFELGLFRKTDI